MNQNEIIKITKITLKHLKAEVFFIIFEWKLGNKNNRQ